MSTSEVSAIAAGGQVANRRGNRRGGRSSTRSSERDATARRLALRFAALGYLFVLLGAPVAMIFYRTFEHGLAPVWDAITQPNAVHAFWLSIELVAIVVPLNTVFGIGM